MVPRQRAEKENEDRANQWTDSGPDGDGLPWNAPSQGRKVDEEHDAPSKMG